MLQDQIHRKIDELMLHHSESLNTKNGQVIRITIGQAGTKITFASLMVMQGLGTDAEDKEALADKNKELEAREEALLSLQEEDRKRARGLERLIQELTERNKELEIGMADLAVKYSPRNKELEVGIADLALKYRELEMNMREAESKRIPTPEMDGLTLKVQELEAALANSFQRMMDTSKLAAVEQGLRADAEIVIRDLQDKNKELEMNMRVVESEHESLVRDLIAAQKKASDFEEKCSQYAIREQFSSNSVAVSLDATAKMADELGVLKRANEDIKNEARTLKNALDSALQKLKDALQKLHDANARTKTLESEAAEANKQHELVKKLLEEAAETSRVKTQQFQAQQEQLKDSQIAVSERLECTRLCVSMCVSMTILVFST